MDGKLAAGSLAGIATGAVIFAALPRLVELCYRRPVFFKHKDSVQTCNEPKLKLSSDGEARQASPGEKQTNTALTVSDKAKGRAEAIASELRKHER